MPIAITSPQNARIKELNKLSKRRVRDERRVTVVEGIREVARALACGVKPVEAYVCSELASTSEAATLVAQLRQMDADRALRLYELTPDVYARIAYREASGGLLIVIPYLEQTLNALPLSRSPFVAVIEGVEKPGNLGAILRTADGAGVDGVIVCTAEGQASTDIHNPNTIRASLGTLFNVPMVEASTAQTTRWLHEAQIRIIATTPHATKCYTDIDFTGPTAVVMGSEATGLSKSWLNAADEQVIIPMSGIADSLNLSIATALLLYEVVRQRSLIS